MAGPGIETTGKAISYNGVSFPFANHVVIRTKMVPTQDGRGYKYSEWVIRVEAIFSGEKGVDILGSTQASGTTINEADDIFQWIFKRLSEPGQLLTIAKHGVGEAWSSNAADLAYGPMPTILDWESVGSNLAMKIAWECVVHVKYCTSNADSYPALLPNNQAIDYSFAETWSIGESGMTVRVIQGQLEVHGKRVSGGGPTAGTVSTITADFHREVIASNFPRLANFKRTQNFSVSPDQRVLTFSISDAEIPSDNAYFLGCNNLQVTRSVSADFPFAKHLVTLNGEIELLPSYPKIYAWFVVVLLVDDQLKKAKPVLRTLESDEHGDPSSNDKWIPVSYSIDEDLFQRRISFSVSMTYICGLDKILKATSMFKPIPNLRGLNNWQQWSASVLDVVGHRGYADLLQLPTDSVIFDPCQSPGPYNQHNSYNRVNPTFQPSEEDDKDPTQSNKPDPERSYIEYKNDFEVEADERSIEHEPLDDKGSRYEINQMNESVPVFVPLPSTVPSVPTSALDVQNGTNVVHKVGSTSYKIHMRGFAARVGYRPSPPSLESFGGLRPIKIGKDRIITKQMAIGSKGLTLYGVSWKKSYVLPAKPIDGSIVTDGNGHAYV
jgi:hypothetical protein